MLQPSKYLISYHIKLWQLRGLLGYLRHVDIHVQLQNAREKMLGAQRTLDVYLKSDVTDLSVFQSLFKSAQDANAEYAAMLKQYMEQKYSHLSH